MQRSDLVHKMKENAEKVQTVVSIIENFKAAVQYTVALTKHQGGTTVTAPDLTASELDLLNNYCEKEGLTFLAVPLRAHADNIHTALTYVDWGIAETGTLVWSGLSQTTNPKDVRKTVAATAKAVRRAMKKYGFIK